MMTNSEAPPTSLQSRTSRVPVLDADMMLRIIARRMDIGDLDLAAIMLADWEEAIRAGQPSPNGTVIDRVSEFEKSVARLAKLRGLEEQMGGKWSLLDRGSPQVFHHENFCRQNGRRSRYIPAGNGSVDLVAISFAASTTDS